MKTVYTTSAILGLAFLLCAGAAVADNTLAVTEAAALEGTFGLAVTLDGSGNIADVRNNRPDAPGDPPGPEDETTYSAQFIINMNNLAMVDLRQHHIMTLRSRAGGPLGLNNRNESRVWVKYREGQANPHKIRSACRNDGGSWVSVGSHSLHPTNNRTVKVEWQAASAPGANDGICRLFVNGVLRGERTDIDNDERAIGQVRLGVDGVDAGSTGSFYYDDFQSFRALGL